MRRKQPSREPDARRRLAFEPLEPRELLAADAGNDWWSSWDAGAADDWTWTFDDSWSTGVGGDTSWDNAWWVGDAPGESPASDGLDAADHDWTAGTGDVEATATEETGAVFDDAAPSLPPEPPAAPTVDAGTSPVEPPAPEAPADEPWSEANAGIETPSPTITDPEPAPVEDPESPAPVDADLEGDLPDDSATAGEPVGLPAVLEAEQEPAAEHSEVPDASDDPATGGSDMDDAVLPDPEFTTDAPPTPEWTVDSVPAAGDDGAEPAVDDGAWAYDEAPRAEPSVPEYGSPEMTTTDAGTADEDSVDPSEPAIAADAEPVETTWVTPVVRPETRAAVTAATVSSSTPPGPGTMRRTWGAFFVQAFGGSGAADDGQAAATPAAGQSGTGRPRLRLPFRPFG